MITFSLHSTTVDKPKLAELRSLKCHDETKIEIINSIAPVWKDFGTLLDCNLLHRDVKGMVKRGWQAATSLLESTSGTIGRL